MPGPAAPPALLSRTWRAAASSSRSRWPRGARWWFVDLHTPPLRAKVKPSQPLHSAEALLCGEPHPIRTALTATGEKLREMICLLSSRSAVSDMASGPVEVKDDFGMGTRGILGAG